MGILDIDLNRLEDEWCNQPKLYSRWKKKYVNVSMTLDNAKTDLDVLESDLSLAIKRDPIKYDLPENAAVTHIAAAVKLTKKWLQANRKINQLQHEKGLIGAVVAALEHRKSALERLVQLHGQDYFSKPVARTQEAAQAVDDIKSQRARMKTQRKTQKGRRDK